MKKLILFAFVLVIASTSMHAQKKKDLLDEIDKLRKELTTSQGELSESRKNAKVSESKVKTMETQVNDLKETNASLLSNMSSFTELSNKKATNLQTSQEIIKAKDQQLNVINTTITAKDSINLLIFSQLKNAIGGDLIKIGNGTVNIMLPNTTLFGQSDKSYRVDQGAKPTLEKIAATLKANSNLNIIVEGNSNALKLDGKQLIDNWDLSSRQAASVVRTLQKDYQIDPKRMKAIGRSEYATEGIETITKIVIDPEFDKFYGLVKNNMKNGSKE